MKTETGIQLATGHANVFRVLNSPEMRRVLRFSRRKCLLHEEFLKMPQPAGWSPDQTWRLLKAIWRECSIEIPITTPQGYRLLYFMHQDLINRLLDLERYCRPESDLYHQLADREGQPFLVKIQVEEAIATSTLDGVSIPYRQAESLIRLDRRPRDAGERLIANVYRAMTDIGAYVDERFSPGLVHEFYDRITEGVNPSSIARGPQRSPLARKECQELAALSPDRHLWEICAYANDEIGEPDEPPAFRAFAIRGAMRMWLPLPDWNGNVASLMYRLYCMKHQYPVLAYLPFSRVLLDWEEGRIQPPLVLTGELPKQYVDENGSEDHTPTMTLAVHLAHRGVLELLAYARLRKQRDERMLSALQNEPSLNRRQRSILSRAIRHPDADFSIRYHQTNHNVAYATARADLLDLVEKGYLLLQKREKAFVFHPHRDLQTRLRLGNEHMKEPET